MSHWARCYCKGERYNFMTSNAAEQLNKALKEGRGCLVVDLFKFIQAMMTRWFNARRRKSSALRGSLPPEVEKVLKEHIEEVKGSHVNQISSWGFDVVGKFGDHNTVLLNERRCTCKKFERLQIPCGHALLAADSVGVLPSTLVGLWNKPGCWKETYVGLVTPAVNEGDVDISEELSELVICPPMAGRAKGRRKEARIPSKGEFPVVRKKKEVPNKCTKCLQPGHNRTRCPSLI
ncbi:unnamed protein product [Microthlaspi erraticum]|uniref:SWIM-type domain-containing protein n=1 Tax=Microthlaspi erraticum TaxID=1685480 RepID=A0A6D2J3Z7_9BRAS|nr:unnamed protein product [Microthlaspi erraticum]